MVVKMTAPGQPQTGLLPVSPENIEQTALWPQGLGSCPRGPFIWAPGAHLVSSVPCSGDMVLLSGTGLRGLGPSYPHSHCGDDSDGCPLLPHPHPVSTSAYGGYPRIQWSKRPRGTLHQDPEAGEGRGAGVQGGFSRKQVCPRPPNPNLCLGHTHSRGFTSSWPSSGTGRLNESVSS